MLRADARKAMRGTIMALRIKKADMQDRSVLLALLPLLVLMAGAATPESDGYLEETELLTLPWKQFDQTLHSGWRIYADQGEHRKAAELIVTFLGQRTDLTAPQRAISNFHAAAEFARVDLVGKALHHLDLAQLPSGAKGVPEDWNELVVSTRAFLLSDREGLLSSRKRVQSMTKPAFPGSADTYLEFFGQRFGAWDDEATR